MLQAKATEGAWGEGGVHLGVFLCEYLAKIKPISIKLSCVCTDMLRKVE